ASPIRRAMASASAVEMSRSHVLMTVLSGATAPAAFLSRPTPGPDRETLPAPGPVAVAGEWKGREEVGPWSGKVGASGKGRKGGKEGRVCRQRKTHRYTPRRPIGAKPACPCAQVSDLAPTAHSLCAGLLTPHHRSPLCVGLLTPHHRSGPKVSLGPPVDNEEETCGPAGCAGSGDPRTAV